jgi:succinyl-diaminopimelate desuccinylase
MSNAPEEISDTETLELLDRLIRCRSVTPDDAGCQDILRQHLDSLGFRCEAMPFADVSNLWARRGDQAPLLCFAGHTDVVPPGPLEQWSSDPFVATRRDGRIYGRGAADMKGSLAAMITALRRFLARHPQHRGGIALLITSDEEGRARDGTLKVIETLTARGDRIDWCIVGEPSSHRRVGDVIRIGRRGSLSGQLSVRGTQGHVAYPQLADNPIRRFAPALAELHEISWDEGNAHFPPTSFQVVRLESDAGAVNVIPGALSARFNFRYSTVWDHEGLRRRVHEILDRHDIDYHIDWHLSGEPFLTRPGPLIDAVVETVRSVAGQDPELSTGGGTSDGRFISPSGADVVELGPVNASIHKIDEHVAIDDLARLTRMYEGIMERLLT